MSDSNTLEQHYQNYARTMANVALTPVSYKEWLHSESTWRWKREIPTNGDDSVELARLQAELAAANERAERSEAALKIAERQRDALVAAIIKWTYTTGDDYSFISDDNGEVLALARAIKQAEGRTNDLENH